MEPFVTRIGDVTIERVVPKSGPGSGGGGTVGKETKEPAPPPSVSFAKRDLDGNDAISVSEDLQVSAISIAALNAKLEFVFFFLFIYLFIFLTVEFRSAYMNVKPITVAVQSKT
jgi:hypothetical protein